jgi:AraC-like DNA-binding protein
MDKFTILGIITLFLVFLSLVLAIFLFTVATHSKTSNRLIGSYVLIFALHISVFSYAKYIELPLVIERLRDQIMFLSSPLLYLYLVSAIYTDFRLERKHVVHLLPFVTAVLIFAPRFYAANEVNRQLFMQSYNITLEARMTAILGILVSLFYLVLMAKELIKYRQILHANYSDKTNFNYKWLVQLTLILILIFTFAQVKQAYRVEMTVQEIMYASGFNSKSSFYAEFRKHVGQTPAAFRKETKDAS